MQISVKQQQCPRAAFAPDVLGGHQGSEKEHVGAKDVTSLLSSYPTPAPQCQVFLLKWLHRFTQLNQPKSNCLAQFSFELCFCSRPEEGLTCPKAQMVFLHYLIRNILSLQRWTNMARQPSPGLWIPVSIQHCSGNSVMAEHLRIICVNMSATAAGHRTCPQWQWDRGDKLTGPPSPEAIGKAGRGWCPLPGPVSMTMPSHFESHIDIP